MELGEYGLTAVEFDYYCSEYAGMRPNSGNALNLAGLWNVELVLLYSLLGSRG
jgi:hypothetical protein